MSSQAANPSWRLISLPLVPNREKVSLELDPRKTVLVGRNGAGKSAVLDALILGRRVALDGARFVAARGVYSFDYLDKDQESFTYSLTISAPEVVDGEPTQDVVESCRRDAVNDFLWRTKAGKTTGTAVTGEVRSTPGIGFVAAMQGERGPWNQVRKLFNGIKLIRAGVPRNTARTSCWVVSKPGSSDFDNHWQNSDSRIQRIAEQLVTLHENDRETFNEYESLICQMKLASKVKLKKMSFANDDVKPASLPDELTSVSFDGCNLGLLSDGTLRVAEILLEVVLRPTLLALEEPETSLHPGLLSRLLSILDSYSHAFQMLVTTQSQQVASWASASQLRLVSRSKGKTSIRGINEKESKRLQLFLDEDMTLGEFVYTGGIDD